MDDFNTAQRPRMMVPIQGRDPGFAPKGQEKHRSPGFTLGVRYVQVRPESGARIEEAAYRWILIDMALPLRTSSQPHVTSG